MLKLTFLFLLGFVVCSATTFTAFSRERLPAESDKCENCEIRAVSEIKNSDIKVTFTDDVDVPEAIEEESGEILVEIPLPIKSYFESLGSRDKVVFARLAEQGVFDQDAYETHRLFKKNGQFYLEAFIRVPGELSSYLPFLVDFKDYRTWFMRDINKEIDGSKPFLRLTDLIYKEGDKGQRFRLPYRFKKLLIGFSGVVEIRIDHDLLSGKNMLPLSMTMTNPSAWVSAAKADIRFMQLPGEKHSIMYFRGTITPGRRILYHILPLQLIDSQLSLRMQVMMHSFLGYRSEKMSRGFKENREKGVVEAETSSSTAPAVEKTAKSKVAPKEAPKEKPKVKSKVKAPEKIKTDLKAPSKEGAVQP